MGRDEFAQTEEVICYYVVLQPCVGMGMVRDKEFGTSSPSEIAANE
jgi:hypothetical protein